MHSRTAGARTGEMRLPERQICLQHVLPTLIEEYLQIEISVQPESLATAGKHDHLALTNRISVQVTGAECQASMLEVAAYMKSTMDEDLLWICWIDSTPRYFTGSTIISEDEYFATALPYHRGKTILQGFPGKCSTS